MNEAIFETVVTTCDAAGRVHVAPMGVRYRGTRVVLMPFKPSATLDNLLATERAVINLTTDTRVFAGCVTGRRRDWPTVPATCVVGERLVGALAHLELSLAEVQEAPDRPRLELERVFEATHAPFVGFNRAQAAVIEGAVLVSRLHLLPIAKIETELAYLQIAIDKTAGDAEREAWGWLRDAVETFKARAA